MKSKKVLGHMFKVAEKEREQMEKPFKKLIVQNEKSIMQILDCVISELLKLGIIVLVNNSRNAYYQIVGTDIALLYLGKNRYKMLSINDVTYISNFTCCYCYGKVIVTLPKALGYNKYQEELEVVLTHYKKYGKLRNGIRRHMSPHHKWFRFCCLEEMMITYSYDDHQTLHNALGRYSHNQSILIQDVKTFMYVINETVKMQGILRNHKFSINS